MRDAVPLPDSLRTCDCRWKPTRHELTCEAAIAWHALPFEQKPGYEPGRALQSFSWVFPHRITGRINIDVEIDIGAVVAKHHNEYRAYELEPGCEEWERPIQFVCALIADQLDIAGVWFGDNRLSHSSDALDELSEHPRWTADDTARVEALLAPLSDLPAVHPDQGTLDTGEN